MSNRDVSILSGSRLIAVLLSTAVIGLPLRAARAESAAPNCEAAISEMTRASEARDAAAARSVAAGASACDGVTRKWLDGNAARLCHNAAQTVALPQTALRARLEDCQTLGAYWPLAAALADLAYERREFALAAKRYDSALSQIAEMPPDAKAPEARIIEALIRQGDQARLLADGFIGSSRSSNGQVTGLGALSTRSIVAAKRNLPIGFEYNQIRFTPDGERAARELRDALIAECRGPVKLIGHTDERGSDDYNLKLSRARALAVVDFLKAGGVGNSGPCALSHDGVGESEPFEKDDATQYTQEDRYRLDRRAEILIGATP